MKYVRTFESFKNNKNEPVNEEFLGAIGKWLGNMFKKAKENIRKTEGGQEIEVIYKKYLKLINDAIVKQTGLNLELDNAVKESKVFEAEEAVTEEGSEVAEGEVEGETTDKKPGEEEKKPVVDVKLLKQKRDILKKIIEQMKGMAAKEMEAVLTKHGGGSKNPQLQIIISAKKDQFSLDVLNAEISALEKSPDDPEAKKLKIELEKESKTLGETIKGWWDKFGKTGKPVEYKEGDTVIYKRNDFKEEEWKKLSDEDKTNKDKWEEVQVGSKSITKIDGDNFTFKDKDDKDISKPITDILLKVKVEEEPKEETESTEETPKEETK